MERIFFTLTIWVTLAFADASALLASNVENLKNDVYLAGFETSLTDPIVTGPIKASMPLGILHHLEGCDADCQAKRLGIVFDE